MESHVLSILPLSPFTMVGSRRTFYHANLFGGEKGDERIYQEVYASIIKGGKEKETKKAIKATRGRTRRTRAAKSSHVVAVEVNCILVPDHESTSRFVLCH